MFRVELKTAFGWVVITPDVKAPFVIGPFDDEEEGNIWLKNIGNLVTEQLTVLGGTMMFLPDSYTEISMLMRERGAAPGSVDQVGGL